MNKTKYIINVETQQELNNDQKTELLADFRARLMGYHTEAPDFIRGSNITITRELTNEDIKNSLTPPRKEIQKYFTFCKHYDEAQGRHKCVNPLVKANRCNGVCEHYEDIREDIN